MSKKYTYEKPTENNPFADRPVPTWFTDAKLGIFIHWGLYSVPAWAPEGGAFPLIGKFLMENNYDISSIHELAGLIPKIAMGQDEDINPEQIAELLEGFSLNPYAEWYWHSMQNTEATANYHKQYHGEKTYEEFREEFCKESAKFDPESWAELFSDAGAKYLITTSKHHDGFCLYPTEIKHPRLENWHSERDLIGELKKATDKKGIEFSLYYSAGVDWSLIDGKLPKDIGDCVMHDEESLDYMDAQTREIIDRYKPSLIWEDIAYSGNHDFHKTLEYYYDKVPHGVVNDRAQPVFGQEKATIHFDYLTTEYFVPTSIRETPWEICRGLTNSFGYNYVDDESTTLSSEELVASLADIVSKNGNLLIGLAPRADGSFPENQIKTVRNFSKWMKVNDEAIYGTKPYKRFDDKTISGVDVRYTQKGEYLYAIVLGAVQNEFCLENLIVKDGSTVEVLGDKEYPVSMGRFQVEPQNAPAGFTVKIKLEDVQSIKL